MNLLTKLVDKDQKIQLLVKVIVLILLVRICLQFIYRVFFHPLAQVPGPLLAKISSFYLVPSQASLRRAYTLRKIHDQYGPVARVGPNEVSISDWRAYRDIYSEKCSSKTAQFYSDTKLAGHDNLFTMLNKKAHSGRRKLQNPSYSQQAVAANQNLIAERANVFVQRLIDLAKDSPSKRTVNAFPLAGLFSLEVILACAFNRQHGSSVNGKSLTLLTAMDASAVGIRIAAVLPILNRTIGRWLPGSWGHSFRQWDVWQQVTQNFLDDFRKTELASDKSQKFMATPLLVNEDGYLHRTLHEEELVEELMGLLFAGSGTTSTTLTYLIYALSKYPLRQARLRDELKTAGDGLNDVKTLPFLNAIIKETMRMYPTIMSTLPRVLDQTLTIGDHILPPGTHVGMQNYVHHRDSGLFAEPDTFIPERWLDEDARKKDMEAALTPFSVGPRNCIGQNLARAELYLATSQIFRTVKLTLNKEMSEEDMEMEDRFNIAPKGRRLLVDVEVL